MSDRPEDVFSSNAVRLSIREWCFVVVVLALTLGAAGGVWKRMERFEPPVDYRMPYDLTEDYWLFNRFCGLVTTEGKTLVLGDSFIWGQYVPKDATLTHFLNEKAGWDRFVNAGLDGAHPLALGGLVRHHCAGLRDGEVILHLNLLWLSSPQADLQGERALNVNHPRLVPQFSPPVPAYGESVDGRIGIVLARNVPLFEWVRHLQKAYFGSRDLARWVLENPYENPIRRLTLTLPESEDNNHPDAQPWFFQSQGLQDLPWVSLESSLQWQAFQRLLSLLRTRGNRVIVVVGPLNEHMLSPANAEVYREVLENAEAWLEENGIPFLAPSTLPSDLYADLSHPLSQGYALLAEEIWGEIGGS